MSMAEAQEAVAQQQAALQAAALHQAHQAAMEAAQHQVGFGFYILCSMNLPPFAVQQVYRV